jgi:hypothetical protein
MNRLKGALPKVGIRPVIDGRLGGVRITGQTVVCPNVWRPYFRNCVMTEAGRMWSIPALEAWESPDC